MVQADQTSSAFPRAPASPARPDDQRHRPDRPDRRRSTEENVLRLVMLLPSYRCEDPLPSEEEPNLDTSALRFGSR